MSWDGLGELWSGPGHCRPLAARLGGGRGGIVSLMPGVWPLYQQLVLIFHMEGFRDPLESSNSRCLPCRQQQSSGLSPHRELGCTAQSLTQIASCKNLDISWLFFFFFTLDHVVFLLVRNFHGKVRIWACIFFFLLLLCFATSPKDLREIAEMISSWNNSIFLIATEFSCKICEQLTTQKLNKWKTRNRVVSFRFFPQLRKAKHFHL